MTEKQSNFKCQDLISFTCILSHPFLAINASKECILTVKTHGLPIYILSNNSDYYLKKIWNWRILE